MRKSQSAINLQILSLTMNNLTEHKSTVLYLFNLSTDRNDQILSFTWDWIEEFAKNFKQVKVYTTHKGKSSSNANIQVTELGGGEPRYRIRAIFRLLVVLKTILTEDNKPMVFHHMSVNTAVIIGLPLRIAGVRQGLWYSHSVGSLKLRIALKFVSKVFSSTPSAFPFRSKKCEFIGHGIRVEDFRRPPARNTKDEFRILSVGRIAPIKNLEKIIQAIHELGNPMKKITFIGPTHEKDMEYRSMLLSLGAECGITVEIHDSVERASIPNILGQYGIFFTGTPKSTDKAAIEAAISGCYVLSENHDTQKIVGMRDFWEKSTCESLSLKNQLEYILKRPPELVVQDRKGIQDIAIRNNDISNLVVKITESLDIR